MARKKKAENNGFGQYLKWFWLAMLSLVLLIIIFYIAVANGLFGPLPDPKVLENPETPEASLVISSDGEILGKYYHENRMKLDYDDLSPHLVNALIATEDIRYRKHSGIDPRSPFTVLFSMLSGDARGGSTITQQLAKNLFHERPDSFLERVMQKFKEWIIAVELERRYTKDEILTMYMNTVDFGHQNYGIRSATKSFFNKVPDSLKIEEAAILVGVLKATSYYSPVLNPENSLRRRNVVMSQMKKYDFITEEEYDSLKQLPIEIKYEQESHISGLATYFREELRVELRKWSKENGVDLYTGGLRIYTTIDSRMQRHAEEATKEHLSQLQESFFKSWKGGNPFRGLEQEILINRGVKQSDRYRKMVTASPNVSMDSVMLVFDKPVKMKVFSWKGEIDTTLSPMDSVKYYKMFLHTGMMAVEPATGHVKAWVGGINYKHFQYDHVNKKAKRQVGSTFKPFVYATGIMNAGLSPCLRVPNIPVVFEEYDNWSPKNSDDKYGGMMALKTGLAQSVNTVTAWVMKQVGPQSVKKLAQNMGIESDIPPVPSIALGTPDISVFEMAGAFNTFANSGTWIEPTYILRIEDKDGNILYEKIPSAHEVMDPGTNYAMVDMLRGVTSGYGTATRLRYRFGFTQDMIGKTGTTQNHSDGWFVGAVPDLTAAVWVGADDRGVHFRNIRYGQGAEMALPIYALFLQKVYKDKELEFPQRNFDVPEEPIPVELNCGRYNQSPGNLNDEKDNVLPGLF